MYPKTCPRSMRGDFSETVYHRDANTHTHLTIQAMKVSYVDLYCLYILTGINNIF